MLCELHLLVSQSLIKRKNVSSNVLTLSDLTFIEKLFHIFVNNLNYIIDSCDETEDFFSHQIFCVDFMRLVSYELFL
jgi:hypothetical protein